MIIDFLNFLFKYSLFAFALIFLQKMLTESFKNRGKNKTKRKNSEGNYDDFYYKEIEITKNLTNEEKFDWMSERENETISQIFDFSTCSCLVSLSDDERHDQSRKREINSKDIKSKSISEKINLMNDIKNSEIFKSQSETNLFFFEPVQTNFKFLSHNDCELSTSHLGKNVKTTTLDVCDNDAKGSSKLLKLLNQDENLSNNNDENEEVKWNSNRTGAELHHQTENMHSNRSGFEACEDDIFLRLNQDVQKDARYSLSAIDASNKKTEKSRKGLSGKLNFKNKERLKMKKNKIAAETNNFSPSTSNLGQNLTEIDSENLNDKKKLNNSFNKEDTLISNNMISRFFSNHNFSMDLYEEKNLKQDSGKIFVDKNEMKDQKVEKRNEEKKSIENYNKKNISYNNKINDSKSFIHGYYRNYLQRKKFHASVLPVYNFKVFGSTEVKANLNLSKEKQQYEQNLQNKLYLHNLQEKLKKKLIFQQEKEKKLAMQQKQHFNFQQKKFHSDVENRFNSKDSMDKRIYPDATKNVITCNNIREDIKSHGENKVSSCLPCLNSFFTECRNLLAFNSIKIPMTKRNKSKICAFNQNAIRTAYSDNNVAQLDTRCNFSNCKNDVSKNSSESLSHHDGQFKNYNGSTYNSNVGHNPNLTANKAASSSQKEIQHNEQTIKNPFEINFVFTTNLSPQTNNYENSFCNKESHIELDNRNKMKDLLKNYVSRSKDEKVASCTVVDSAFNNYVNVNKQFWEITDYLFIGEKHYATNAHFLCQKSISGLVILYREEFKPSKKDNRKNFERKKNNTDFITETDSAEPNTMAFTERAITAVPCVCSQSTDRHNRSALRIDMSGFNLSEVRNSFVEINRYIDGFKKLNKKVMILNDTESSDEEQSSDHEIIESVIADKFDDNNKLNNSKNFPPASDDIPTSFSNNSLPEYDEKNESNNDTKSCENKIIENSIKGNLVLNIKKDKNNLPKNKKSVLCENKEESYLGSSVDPCAGNYDQYTSDATDAPKFQKVDCISSNDKTKLNHSISFDGADNKSTRTNNDNQAFENQAFENQAFENQAFENQAFENDSSESIRKEKNYDTNSNSKCDLAYPPRPPLPKRFDDECTIVQSHTFKTDERKDNFQILNVKTLTSSLRKVPPMKPPLPKNIKKPPQTYPHKSVFKTNSEILSVQSSKFIPNEILIGSKKVEKKSKNKTKIPARPPPPVLPLRDDVLCVLIALQHIISSDGLTFEEAIFLFKKANYPLKLSKAVTSMLKMIDWSSNCQKGVECPRMI